ncbi:MAG: adenine deaminase [Eubacteriales bacterium]|nr:adenine deaminase [Eubacteriales bacterium]
MNVDKLKNIVNAASGKKKSKILFKNGYYVNLFTEKVEKGTILVEDDTIVAIGNDNEYEAEKEIDLNGDIIVPSFIDSHIHLESGMVSPRNFEKAVLPHGTQAIICDPHEITNVLGTKGIDYIIQSTSNLILDVFINIPSCVPSTPLDESGDILLANNIKQYYDNERVLGLAELMNFLGTVNADDEIMKKENDAINANKCIDGHSPNLSGKGLNAYIASGVQNDHECANMEEAIEKLERGMYIQVREGTACKNLDALLPMFEEPLYQRALLACDDIHPGDLIRLGHIDYIVRRAIKNGKDPIKAIKMGTLNPCIFYNLKRRGAIAPSYLANFFICDDLQNLNIKEVYYKGELVVKDNICLFEEKKEEVDKNILDKVYNSFHMDEININDITFNIKKEENKKLKQRVIEIIPGGVLTNELIFDINEINKEAIGVDTKKDIIKLVNFERHLNTHHIGHGFIKGYGLKDGAIASTIAHDSHNLIIVGTNDKDIVFAANTIRKNKGGLCVVKNGVVLGELPLPIAGIMSDIDVEEVDKILEDLKEKAYSLGVNRSIDPFMTLAFMALPVIPNLKLTTLGLVQVECQKIVPSLYYE